MINLISSHQITNLLRNITSEGFSFKWLIFFQFCIILKPLISTGSLVWFITHKNNHCSGKGRQINQLQSSKNSIRLMCLYFITRNTISRESIHNNQFLLRKKSASLKRRNNFSSIPITVIDKNTLLTILGSER